MNAKRRRIPDWALWTLGAALAIGLAGWASVTYDSHGNPVLDADLTSLIIGLAGLLVPALIIQGRRTRDIDHEMKPNSGGSSKDQWNRMESMMQTLVKDNGDIKRDIGGLREENRNDRKADADRFDVLDGRLTHLEQQKEKP